MRRYGWLVVGVIVLALWAWQQRPHASSSMQTPSASMPDAQQSASRSTTSTEHGDSTGWPAYLPSQAIDTLQRIEHGGPFTHRQDGAIFQNRERLLPPQARGYYHEYTVETPGSRDRGARRIISGGQPPSEFFYSDDHYRSFKRFTPTTGAMQ